MNKASQIYLNNRYFIPLKESGRIISIDIESNSLFILLPRNYDKDFYNINKEFTLDLNPLSRKNDCNFIKNLKRDLNLKLKTKESNIIKLHNDLRRDYVYFGYSVNYNIFVVKNFHAMSEVNDYLKQKPELLVKPKVPERRIEPRFRVNKELTVIVNKKKVAYVNEVSFSGLSIITFDPFLDEVFKDNKSVKINMIKNNNTIVLDKDVNFEFNIIRNFPMSNPESDSNRTFFSGSISPNSDVDKLVWFDYIYSKFSN